MTYKYRDELVAGLRELADFIEERGHLMPVDSIQVSCSDWVYDDYQFSDKQHPRTAHEKMRLLAKALGKAEKRYQGDYFDLSRKFGPVKLEFTVPRNKVCERVVKEVKEIPAKLVPAKLIEAHTEEVIEWVCNDPILQAAEKTE